MNTKVEDKKGEEGNSRGVEKSERYMCGGENQVGKKKKTKEKNKDNSRRC